MSKRIQEKTSKHSLRAGSRSSFASNGSKCSKAAVQAAVLSTKLINMALESIKRAELEEKPVELERAQTDTELS